TARVLQSDRRRSRVDHRSPLGRARARRGGGSVRFPATHWAVVLGGSSGFGLATAQKLAAHGMSCFLVHRDRRGAMARIEPEFDRIRQHGVSLVTMNLDALDPAGREECIARLATSLGPEGRVRVLLHSIAFGNLKLLLPEPPRERPTIPALATGLGIEAADVAAAANRLFGEGFDPLAAIADSPAYPSAAFLDEEDFARTIHSMGTSLLTWARALLDRGLFADDARLFGL